jgi:hypothetical protein
MSVLRGMFRLATFRPEGFGEFGDTRQAFLNSLAPLLAFPLVGTALLLLTGAGAGALGDLLGTVVALLAPVIVSHALAVRWGREAAWMRYAVAFNWCQWAVPLFAVGLVVVAGILVNGGLPVRLVTMLLLLALLGYGLGLYWFLARHGLGLSGKRAALLVLLMNLATGLLAFGPRLFFGQGLPATGLE